MKSYDRKRPVKNGILNAISDWLKLLALIVLVAEAFLTAIVFMTGRADPYAALGIGLLGVIVAGFFYDRYLQSESPKKVTKEVTVNVSRDQDADDQFVLDSIERATPATVDFLEFSGAYATKIIATLKKKNCRNIRLLLKHPETVGDYQARRILQQLEFLYRLILDQGFESAELRCYRHEASLRGRKFGQDLINVGWYTPDVAKPDMEVRGHSNPMISAPLSSPEGLWLARMFDGLFQQLWGAPETEEGSAVLKRMKNNPEIAKDQKSY